MTSYNVVGFERNFLIWAIGRKNITALVSLSTIVYELRMVVIYSNLVSSGG